MTTGGYTLMRDITDIILGLRLPRLTALSTRTVLLRYSLRSAFDRDPAPATSKTLRMIYAKFECKYLIVGKDKIIYADSGYVGEEARDVYLRE
ncbi:MAG: hypothetical protein LBK73_05230 [Treponema sp.]|jgi:hypothetical protein|nr:hypothetical protein [Treponema sp.]